MENLLTFLRCVVERKLETKRFHVPVLGILQVCDSGQADQVVAGEAVAQEGAVVFANDESIVIRIARCCS